MNKIVKNINFSYNDNQLENKQAVILLHGWGQNKEIMDSIANSLKNNRTISVDLPGHGQSEEPKTDLELNEIVDLLKELFDKLNIKTPILIGHSFGGKLALLYASKNDTKKLIILAAPYKKEIENLNLKTKILKSLVKIPLLNKLEDFAKRHIGSNDYKKASLIMRKIMVNHLNLDITEQVKKITCPTLLIWGTNDQEVDISRAYELEKLIKNSAVIEYQNRTHYAYLEDINKTNNIIENFIESRG